MCGWEASWAGTPWWVLRILSQRQCNASRSWATASSGSWAAASTLSTAASTLSTTAAATAATARLQSCQPYGIP
jgi:hypothetical protein